MRKTENYNKSKVNEWFTKMKELMLEILSLGLT
jgi:hypothetical protein